MVEFKPPILHIASVIIATPPQALVYFICKLWGLRGIGGIRGIF
jgi:hypothetical protein